MTDSPMPPTRSTGVTEDGRPVKQVRSFVRRGRHSELTRSRIATLGPRHAVPPGPLVPKQAFGRVAPVVVEIGAGHGHAAVAYARTHPGDDIVAIDVHTPGLARMLALADEEGVTNLWVEEGDALDFLADRVTAHSIAAIHIFFPDPWPKTKHVKRRLVSAAALDIFATVLEPNGHVLLATDQQFYADHVREVVSAHGGWAASDVERPDWRPLDGFERKGRLAGRAIHELRLDVGRGNRI